MPLFKVYMQSVIQIQFLGELGIYMAEMMILYQIYNVGEFTSASSQSSSKWFTSEQAHNRTIDRTGTDLL